jgi:hypothetical protein
VEDADLEEGEVVQPPSPDEQQQQQQQQRALPPPPREPVHYKNLFGPVTVSGYVLKQYNPLDHFCQLPLVSAIAQHCGSQVAASAAAAAAAKQASGTRARGLLAVLQQRGLQLRWTPEILSSRSEDWLMDDHEQVGFELLGGLGWAKCAVTWPVSIAATSACVCTQLTSSLAATKTVHCLLSPAADQAQARHLA